MGVLVYTICIVITKIGLRCELSQYAGAKLMKRAFAPEAYRLRFGVKVRKWTFAPYPFYLMETIFEGFDSPVSLTALIWK